MNTKIKYILVYFLLFFSSCQDFLDVKPVGKLIPTQVEEYENILNSTYTVDGYYKDSNRGSFLAYLGDNLQLSENIAELFYTATNPAIYRYTAYVFKTPYENPEKSSTFWQGGIYKAVELFNCVIDGVKEVRTSETAVLADELMAQAKAGRAWAYLTATLVYGPMYIPGHANDTKTIPYRTTSSATEPNPSLSTTAEAFAAVKKDLEDALLHAPKQVANPSRANLAAVQALMAYYYMFVSDFPNMLKYADMAWSSSLANKGSVDNMIYDYNDFYYEPNPNAKPAPGVDVETALELRVKNDDLLNQTNNRENLFYRVAAYIQHQQWGYPSDEFLDLFDRTHDLRFQLFALNALGYSKKVGQVTYDDGVVRQYFKDRKISNGNQGITHPELLLMRAEAYARTKQLELALKDLNLLRSYRYDRSLGNTDLPNGSSYTQDQLLEEILKERRRELPLATFQRFLDLKRLSLDTGKPWCKTAIEHKVGDQTYSAPVNSEFYILPIPNNIIKYNPQWGITLDERPYNPK